MKNWLCLLLLSCPVSVLACIGCNTDVELKINVQLTESQNSVGHVQSSSAFNVGMIDAQLYSNVSGQWQTASFTNFDGTVPTLGTRPTDWQYQKIDDYLSIAIRLKQTCGYIYAPFNRQGWLQSTCQDSYNLSNIWGATTWDSSLKITRKLVSGTYGKRILLGRFGTCAYTCASPTLTLANVYLTYTITVPQSCEINANNIVVMDFGNISSRLFKIAGEKVNNVKTQEKEIGIKCNNIAAASSMSLRIQSDRTSGDILISDNADVGFVITDKDDNKLTPNTLSSKINFQLDSESQANVKIKAYPVSATGNTPVEGPVVAKGYLRVDFD